MSPEEIHAPITWRTAVVSVGAALGLAAAAVGGFLLAGRGGGLARADRALSLLPVDTVAVALLEAQAVLGRAELCRPLAELMGASSSGDCQGLTDELGERFQIALRRAARAYLFVRAAGGLGLLLEGDLRAGDLRGAQAGEHLGVELHRAGPATAALVGEGRAVLGSGGAVQEVIALARGLGRSLPAHPLFSTWRDLAVRARGHPHLQMVVLPNAARIPELEEAWPAIRGAAALGLFAHLDGEEAEVLALLAGAAPSTEPKGLTPTGGPLSTLLAGAKLERPDGLVELKARLPVTALGAAARWLVSTVSSGAGRAAPRP
jgi:hypothetical protein